MVKIGEVKVWKYVNKLYVGIFVCMWQIRNINQNQNDYVIADLLIN